MKKQYLFGIAVAIMIGVSQMAGCTVERKDEPDHAAPYIELQNRVKTSYFEVERARLHKVPVSEVCREDLALVLYAVVNMDDLKRNGYVIPPDAEDQVMQTYDYVMDSENINDVVGAIGALVGNLSKGLSQFMSVLGLLDSIAAIMPNPVEVSACTAWSASQGANCMNEAGKNHDGFTSGEGLCAALCCVQASTIWMIDCLDNSEQYYNYETQLRYCQSEVKMTGPNGDCAYSLLL
ncbi:MAG: hypothetical protein ACOYUZ_03825 [Patescibacteria group bacterium]